MSAEIRLAIEKHLAQPTNDEMAILDMTTRQAERDIAEITASMKKTVEALDNAFEEIERFRAKAAKATKRGRLEHAL